MKKVITIAGVFLFSLLLITSCGGPSACDCLKEFNKDPYLDLYNIDANLLKRCVEKYGKDIPQELRGTEEFSRRLKEIVENKCRD